MKQVKIDISCKNKKMLRFGCFFRYHYQFSHSDKKFPFLDLSTNSKQRYGQRNTVYPLNGNE